MAKYSQYVLAHHLIQDTDARPVIGHFIRLDLVLGSHGCIATWSKTTFTYIRNAP